MRIMEILSYFSGADYLRDHYRHQDRLLTQSTGNREALLPLDGDAKIAAQIYADRIRMIFEYPVIIAARMSGTMH